MKHCQPCTRPLTWLVLTLSEIPAWGTEKSILKFQTNFQRRITKLTLTFASCSAHLMFQQWNLKYWNIFICFYFEAFCSMLCDGICTADTQQINQMSTKTILKNKWTINHWWQVVKCIHMVVNSLAKLIKLDLSKARLLSLNLS